MEVILTRTSTGLISVVMAAGLLAIGWWPFAFRPHNGVGWVKGRTGLIFQPDGVIYDEESADWSDVSGPEQLASATFELWLEPFQESNGQAPSILTIDDGGFPSGMALAQWQTELLLRQREPGDKEGYREVGAAGALVKHTPRVLAVTLDPSGTTFYRDGSLLHRCPGNVVRASQLKGRLILGDAAEGGHCWAGQLFGLALFQRALDASEIARHQVLWTNRQADRLVGESGLAALYLFDEGNGQWAQDHSPHDRRLLIPEHYRVLQKTVLALPWGAQPFGIADLGGIALNLLGFVPFGFMVYCHRRLARPDSRTWNILWAVAVGAAVSLAIELVQAWLPNRFSSATDFAASTLGTLIGVLIAARRPLRSPRAGQTSTN